jgi:hypothetical protein
MPQPIRQRDRIITPDQARNSIFIDFEGEGESRTNGLTPEPHMLGAYTPKYDIEKAVYRAFLFRENWKPVANGSGGQAIFMSLEDSLQKLIDAARMRGGYLVYFSDHERKVIEMHCPSLYEAFMQVAFNAKPAIDRMYNRHHPQDTGSRPDSLEGYARFYFPAMTVATLKEGAAETCRKLDRWSADSQRWRAWKPKHKALAKSLLEYNRSDCRMTWKLTKRLANAQANKQPDREAA